MRFLLSIGCNVNRDVQMARAQEVLRKTFPGISFSKILTSPDDTNAGDPYSNCIARGNTDLSEEELCHVLKTIERQLGRTESKHVMMDLDLLQYGDAKRHLSDWERPYIKALLSPLLLIFVFAMVFVSTAFSHTFSSPNRERQGGSFKSPQELLTKATEYFQGGKYHEAILNFEKLQQDYTLTPRYLAYLGFAYYKEGNYEDAAKTLFPLLRDTTSQSTLAALSPKEQSVYLYACGESLFHIGNYTTSLDIHNRMLPLVKGLDKADVLFHIGMAHYMQGNYADAIPPLEEALSLYKSLTTADDELHKARLNQIDTMLPGLRRVNPSPTLPREGDS